jgi:RecB family endonuclease NucS
MPTTIKIWEIADKALKPVAESVLAKSHKETELEDWIATTPDLIADGVLVFDRQRDIPGVGRLDLLGIDEDGTLVIIELKRDRAPREAVAQALDYASWLDAADSEVILQNADMF